MGNTPQVQELLSERFPCCPTRRHGHYFLHEACSSLSHPHTQEALSSLCWLLSHSASKPLSCSSGRGEEERGLCCAASPASSHTTAQLRSSTSRCLRARELREREEESSEWSGTILAVWGFSGDKADPYEWFLHGSTSAPRRLWAAILSCHT